LVRYSWHISRTIPHIHYWIRSAGVLDANTWCSSRLIEISLIRQLKAVYGRHPFANCATDAAATVILGFLAGYRQASICDMLIDWKGFCARCPSLLMKLMLSSTLCEPMRRYPNTEALFRFYAYNSSPTDYPYNITPKSHHLFTSPEVSTDGRQRHMALNRPEQPASWDL
jgi:hypothetical protein